MTTQRKAHKVAGAKKLKLKKETLRDLDLQKKGKDIKGGMAVQKMRTGTCFSCEAVGC